MQSLPSIKGIGAIYSTSAQWINGMLTSGDYPWAADVPEATANGVQNLSNAAQSFAASARFLRFAGIGLSAGGSAINGGYEIYMGRPWHGGIKMGITALAIGAGFGLPPLGVG